MSSSAAGVQAHNWRCWRPLPNCFAQRRWEPRRPSSSAGAAAAEAKQQALAVVGFTLILDDIVLPPGLAPDFTVLPAQLGGGGPQGLLGFRLACRDEHVPVGLAAGVGADLPQSVRRWLDAAGVDTTGLVLHPGMPTPRAWQVLEPDGQRHEIWRTQQGPAQAAMLLPSLDRLPPAYRAARAYHVGINPSAPPLALLAALHSASASRSKVLVLAETFCPAARPLCAADLRTMLQHVDVFSPNEQEAVSMVCADGGEAAAALRAPTRLTEPLLDAGAEMVVLRRGARGAVVHGREGGAWTVPAFPDTKVVDPTGCGNAFCGAFVAALLDGRTLEEAGAWGAAAASIVAEAQGIPQQQLSGLRAIARGRAEVLTSAVARL